MKAEKVILSFIAIIVGLVAAGVAFYFYQVTKTVPEDQNKPIAVVTQEAAAPTPEEKLLTIDSPKEEEVFNKKLITIKGKTESGATVVVSSETADDVVTPAANGEFSLTHTIPDGTTVIEITAIFPNGEEERVTRTVTFSTEEF